MLCPNCGAKTIEDAVFCQKCGARLDVDIPVEEPAEASGADSVQQSPSAPMNAPVKKKFGKIPVLLGIAALTAVILIVLIYSGPKKPRSPINIEKSNFSQNNDNETKLTGSSAGAETSMDEAELLFDGNPVLAYLGGQIDAVMDDWGTPLHYDADFGPCEYKGIIIYFDAQGVFSAGTIYNVEMDSDMCTFGGISLDKKRAKIINTLGAPTREEWVEQYFNPKTNNYEKIYCLYYDGLFENNSLIIEFPSPSDTAFGIKIVHGFNFDDEDLPPSEEFYSAVITPDTFVGDWQDLTSTYNMSIEYVNDTYQINIVRNFSDSEWQHWSLTGYYDENYGIIYSGGTARMYMRGNGTVGGGGSGYDVKGIIFPFDDFLYWNDYVEGIGEICFERK